MTTSTLAAVRPGRLDDAEAIADLASQLGYPSTPEQLIERLPHVMDAADAALLVATDALDRPIGWLHVELKRSLVAPPAAQVMGLVVAEESRSRGIGAQLLRRAEEWARTRGCHAVLVATRVTRGHAHRFYRREGYRLLKTSHAFQKNL